MTLAEPLHTDSQPRDGFYFMYGKPRDPAKPRASRPKIPIRIWTHAPRDEVGDLIDDVRQYVKIGTEVVAITQNDWMYIASNPISETEYTDMYITGDWQ